MKRRYSPQEKKLLAYSRDNKNVYGENSKASRKGIRKRKALHRSSFRRSEHAILGGVTGVHEEENWQLEDQIANVKQRRWRKVPDRPLAEWVDERLSRRERLGISKKTSPSRLQRLAGRKRSLRRGPW